MTIHELAIGCRTYRRFEQEPVPEEIVREALENARIAASAGNQQPLRFVVIQSPEKLAEMQTMVHWAALLPKEIGTPVEGEQPTLFIVIEKAKKNIPSGEYDIGIACDRIGLTMWEHGFGSCIIANIEKKRIHELIGTPEEFEARVVMGIGKPQHKSTIVDLPESGETKYYVDEKRDYYVPKRAFDDIVRFL